MKKTNFTEKVIKRFYGITGPLDEYKRHIADRIGNMAFIYLSACLMLSNLIALVLAVHFPQVMAWLYPGFVQLLLMGIFLYVIIQGKKAGLSNFEMAELDAKTQKQIRYIGLKSGLYFAIGTSLMNPLLDYLIDGVPFLTNLLSPFSLLGALFSGLFFGIACHVIIQLRMRKENQDD